MLNNLQPIDQPYDVLLTIVKDPVNIVEEIECPTCGFGSKPVNNTEHECCNGHRFKH